MCDNSNEQHEVVRLSAFILQYGTQEDVEKLTKTVHSIAEEIQARAKEDSPIKMMPHSKRESFILI